jgi:hypothetical protein
MRSLLAALALLVVLAPACEEQQPEPDRLEALADNLCGEEARCMVESCSDVVGLVPDQDDCTAECRSSPCSPTDTACQMAYSDVRSASNTIYTRCAGGTDASGRPYTDADCEDAVAMCDDVPDPVAS